MLLVVSLTSNCPKVWEGVRRNEMVDVVVETFLKEMNTMCCRTLTWLCHPLSPYVSLLFLVNSVPKAISH